MNDKPAAPGTTLGPIDTESDTELEAARRVVSIAKRYRDWMFGAQITPTDKSELIAALDAYEGVVNGQ